MTYFEAAVIAIVEGITEFLPISSTGHMMIAQWLLDMPNDDFTKAFIVNIQFGAILSVVVLYWKRFFQSLNFYYILLFAFLPAAVFGLLLDDYIDKLLANVAVVGITLFLGGFILLFVDKWFKANETITDGGNSYKKAFLIGLFQCVAMIPGVSRSAATIIGGLTQKMNRKTAAEFSFFLAVPTMAAASGYKLLQNYKILTIDNLGILLFGNVIAFIVALVAIKAFVGYLTKYGFKLFGWYRIIVGLILIILMLSGVNLEILD